MAYEFNGSNQYLEINFPLGTFPLIPQTDDGTQWSMHMWLNTQAQGDAFYCGESTDPDDYFRVFHYTDETILTWHRGEMALSPSTSTGTYAYNVWHSVGSRFGSDKEPSQTYMDSFINGVIDPADARFSPLNNDTYDRICIARLGDSSPSSYYDGIVAEVAVWQRALTDEEFVALSHGFSPLFFRNKLHYYFPLVDDLNCRVSGESLTQYNNPTIVTHPRVIQPMGAVYPGVPASGPTISIPSIVQTVSNRLYY